MWIGWRLALGPLPRIFSAARVQKILRVCHFATDDPSRAVSALFGERIFEKLRVFTSRQANSRFTIRAG